MKAAAKDAGVDLPEKKVNAETLARLTGYDTRRIFQLVDSGDIPRPAKKGDGYPLAASVQGIVGYLQKQASGDTAAKARDMARMAKADADKSELNAGKELSVLMYVADAKRLWSDALVRVREKILRTTGLTMKQKTAIADAIQSIKLRASDEEESQG